MLAATRQQYGGPDVIDFADVPDPTAGRGEIVVRVVATSVNRTDCAYRSGHPWINRAVCGWPRPRVKVLGSQYAGVVDEVGEDVDHYVPGDRVLGFVDGRPGAHAARVAVAVDSMIAAVPDPLELVDAAAVMEGGLYARAFLRVTGLGRGDRAMVHGATGAIGTALVQLLGVEGVDVTAVCDRVPDDRPGLLEDLGAARVIDLREDTLRSAGTGFDAVLAATGHLSFAAARQLLRPGGSYASSELGRGGQNLALAAIGPAARRLGRRSVQFPVPHADAHLAHHLTGLMEAGAYRAVVDRTYDFADLRAAYAYVETGRKVGTVLVLMPGRTDD